jgi:membrane protease YdiL (CAAX protease family)
LDTPETLATTISAHAPGLSILVLMAGGFGLQLIRAKQSMATAWTAGVDRLRRCPIIIGDAELLLFLLLLPRLLGGIAALSTWGAVRPTPTGPDLLLGAILLQVCLIVGIAMVWLRHPRDRAELFSLPRVRLGHDLFNGVVLLLRACPYLILVSALVLLLHQIGLPAAPQDAVRLLRSSDTPQWVLWGLIGTAVITAPLLEEIIFRGLLLPACLKHRSPYVAIALVSILFATVHLNATSILPLTCLGIVLATAYIRTGSLLVPITMHMTYNALQILIILQTPEILP